MLTTKELQEFVHLHVHTEYSFLDGYNPIKKLVARAKELGMKAVTITDHNHLGGCLDFQRECKKQGIKPILGLEGYYTWDTNIASLPVDQRNDMAINAARKAGVLAEEQEPEINPKTGKPKKTTKLKQSDIKDIIAPYKYDMTQYHIILIAINQTGWENLVKLQSEAADKCTYNGRFLCDDEMLAKYNEGLVFSTACIGNAAAELINEGKVDEAKAQLVKWHNIFGDRMFLEIQPLNIEKQWHVNLAYMSLAEELGINLIATCDVHWTAKEDYDDHDTLLCIGTGKYKDDPDRMRYSNDFWLKDAKEMIESFEIQADSMVEYHNIDREQYMTNALQAIANTSLIADAIEDIRLGSETQLFPDIQVPFNLPAEKWMISECYQKLYKYARTDQYVSDNLRGYENRLNEELRTINAKGFAPYMLVVDDYVAYADSHDNGTGPGRGSAAGSLTLYLLGITKNIDPVKNDLLFSRFLTSDRTSPPDVDSDFNDRDMIIDRLKSKYGNTSVSLVGTITRMGVKSGLKDVGRALQVDFALMNAISKSLDEILDMPQPKFADFDALKGSDKPQERQRWIEFNKLEEANKELFRLARAFEGNPRNMGVHASGVLVVPGYVTNYFPTRKDKTGATVTLWDKDQIEDLGGIKFDILGLSTLGVIKETLKLIDPTLTFDQFYKMVDVNDPEIFKMIRRKETDGVFQLESNLFKSVIDDIQPTCIDDITVINALCRPGPLTAQMPQTYAKRKRGDEEVVEPLPNTLDIVQNTYGVIAYQEQFMQISVRVAGFNMNQADSLARKIVAKKKKDQMEMLRRIFFYGKQNIEGPADWEKDAQAPWYDPKNKYGDIIPGAVSKGYDIKDLTAFWEMIQGFCDYMFNRSHAACYAYIGILTAWLKHYYPVQFMAALLSAQTEEEKIANYITVAEAMQIKITTPDINKSGVSFTPDGNTIMYGLGSIKGVGESSIPQLIANQPYQSLEDAMERIDKKSFNKTVGMSLIKAGAFDFLSTNRYELMNHFMNVRKDKDDRYDIQLYNEDVCMEMEKSVLGISITYKPWWNSVTPNKAFSVAAELIKVDERPDKKGNMMAFITLKIKGSQIKGLVFASKYCKLVDMFDMSRHTEVMIDGKKDDRGSLIINNAHKIPANTKKALVNEDQEIVDRIARLIA